MPVRVEIFFERFSLFCNLNTGIFVSVNENNPKTKKMKTNYLLLVILMVLFTACEKEDDIGPEDTNTIIGGEIFTPSESSAEKSPDGMILTFTGEGKKVQIVTNDTVAGTYNIISQSLKSTQALQANITYNDGLKNYNGTSGTVQVTHGEEGTVSGTYDATLVSDDDDIIEVSSGSFTNMQLLGTSPAISLISTEAGINDTLELCYGLFYNYVEFLYLFDAVYTNTTSAPAGSWDDIHGHAQSDTDEKVLMLWSKSYEIIFMLNLILESTEDLITDVTVRNPIDAQVKAMRAYIYHNLLIWFGEVPIETGFSENGSPRNPVDEVLNQIKDDANMAVEFLPQSWPVGDEFRFPKSLAQGLLSRVHLFDNNYQEALNMTQQIVNSGQYSLSQSTSNFVQGDSEIIWGFDRGSNNEFNDFFTKGLYVPVMRLTEMYLIAAEASYNIGNPMEALNYINMLKARSGEPEIMSVQSADILEQWVAELESEGSTFNTLKRFDVAESELQIQPHKLLLPIPADVINSNSNMTQNPGY